VGYERHQAFGHNDDELECPARAAAVFLGGLGRAAGWFYVYGKHAAILLIRRMHARMREHIGKAAAGLQYCSTVL
jgi:hypothetical protein